MRDGSVKGTSDSIVPFTDAVSDWPILTSVGMPRSSSLQLQQLAHQTINTASIGGGGEGGGG